MKGKTRICELPKILQLCTTVSFVVMQLLLPLPSFAVEQQVTLPDFKMLRANKDYSY
jgi:hypothetical protein